MSLAATIGVDARRLLETDDATLHGVYRKIVDGAMEAERARLEWQDEDIAIRVINRLGEALDKGA